MNVGLVLQQKSAAAETKTMATSHRNAKAFPKQLFNSVMVVGHRGNSAEAPENTITSLNEAFALGADMVEVDVYFSRDGIPVVIHDETVDRTTNGKGLVADLTLAQLKALDAGSWKGRKYAKERIPTFEEVLRAAKGKGPVFLDPKVEGLGRSVAELLQKLGMDEYSLVIGTWTESQASDFVRYLPRAQILRTDDDTSRRAADFFEQQKARGITGFELGMNWSPEFIQAAHAHGMPVYAYTINDESTMRELVTMGIDAIETDVPKVLIRLLKSMSKRAGEESPK